MAKVPARSFLSEKDRPTKWYNMKADMKALPDPMLIPGTFVKAKPEDLHGIFSKELSRQEFMLDRYLEIPEEIQKYYAMFRPSPLHRAYELEKKLGTPARIYYKYEGGNSSGSHKLNSALAQAYYNKQEGVTKLVTETGAGQWGTALSMACSYLDMELLVYMVKISSQQKPYRKAIMESFGSIIIESPSNTTNVGREILIKDPNNTGSLGTAIGEAVEIAAASSDTNYVLGSVLDQVLLHQSIIGLEVKKQMENVDEYPDIVIGCSGGGSNLGGIMAAYMRDRLTGADSPYFIAVEPTACPSFTRGKYAYDFCDTGKVTPLAKMYTLGSGFMPSSIHSGGLRYHGMSPVLSKLYHDGFIDEARAVKQNDVFAASVEFARTEGILPAPESGHAILAARQEALKCKETGEQKSILFCLSGHGNFDMASYMQYNLGNVIDFMPTDEDLEKGFASLPVIK